MPVEEADLTTHIPDSLALVLPGDAEAAANTAKVQRHRTSNLQSQTQANPNHLQSCQSDLASTSPAHQVSISDVSAFCPDQLIPSESFHEASPATQPHTPCTLLQPSRVLRGPDSSLCKKMLFRQRASQCGDVVPLPELSYQASMTAACAVPGAGESDEAAADIPAHLITAVIGTDVSARLHTVHTLTLAAQVAEGALLKADGVVGEEAAFVTNAAAKPSSEARPLQEEGSSACSLLHQWTRCPITQVIILYRPSLYGLWAPTMIADKQQLLSSSD